MPTSLKAGSFRLNKGLFQIENIKKIKGDLRHWNVFRKSVAQFCLWVFYLIIFVKETQIVDPMAPLNAPYILGESNQK